MYRPGLQHVRGILVRVGLENAQRVVQRALVSSYERQNVVSGELVMIRKRPQDEWLPINHLSDRRLAPHVEDGRGRESVVVLWAFMAPFIYTRKFLLSQAPMTRDGACWIGRESIKSNALANICFGLRKGLKSNAAPCPKSAKRGLGGPTERFQLKLSM